MVLRYVVAVIGGVILGAGAGLLIPTSPLALIPWGAAALGLGLWRARILPTVISAAVYGYVMVLSFLVAAYNGPTPIVNNLGAFLLLAIVGIVCAVPLALLGHAIVSRRRRSAGE